MNDLIFAIVDMIDDVLLFLITTGRNATAGRNLAQDLQTNLQIWDTGSLPC